MKNTNPVKIVTCYKCKGTGVIPHFSHVMGGVCFECKGRGKVKFREPMPRTTWFAVHNGDGAELFSVDIYAKTAKGATTKIVAEARKFIENWNRMELTLRANIMAEFIANPMVTTDKPATGFIFPEEVSKWDREKAEAEARHAEAKAIRDAENALTTYTGVVGERTKFELKTEYVHSFDGMYGTTYISIFKDSEGHTIVYKGNHIARKNDRVVMVATIKEHTEYNGTKQTIIARPKVSEVIAPSI